jgi:hypothetical protein
MYFINSPYIRKKLNELQTGTTRQRISRRNLSTIQFPIPPLKEQLRIVSKVESLLSEHIEAEKGLQKAKKQLEIYKQALLKYAFKSKHRQPNPNHCHGEYRHLLAESLCSAHFPGIRGHPVQREVYQKHQG